MIKQFSNIKLLIFSIVCLIAFIILVFVILFRTTTTQFQESPKPTIEPNHSSESTLKYEDGTQGKLYDKLTGERELTNDDKAKRSSIISEIGGESGTLYESQNVLLGYLLSPDYFQAEIRTTNDLVAKTEVVNWFLSKGISRNGICSLPIMFILDENTSDIFIESKKEFNPLAPGC